MVDIFTREKRTEIMRKIGPKNTSHELFIENILSSLRYKFRTHDNILPGKPDIVFAKRKKVIFVNGCFWHRHKKCGRSKIPKTNTLFWLKKIQGNAQRDKLNKSKLRKLGWSYLEIWQCEIKRSREGQISRKLKNFLDAPSVNKAPQ